jgi:hypothetical protein
MLRAYYKVMTKLAYYTDSAKLDGADKGRLSINGMKPNPDAYCAPGRIWGINPKTFKWMIGSDFAFEKANGQIYTLIGTDAQRDVYGARCRVYGQLVGVDPQQNWRLGDLNPPALMS